MLKTARKIVCWIWVRYDSRTYKLLTSNFILTARYATWYMISVMPVCLSVCLSVCQTITFESLDVGSSCSLVRYVSTEYGSSLYYNVYEGQGHGSKNVQNPYSRSLKNSIGNKSASVTRRPVKFAFRMFGYGGSNGVTAMFVTWLEVTTHSRVVGFRLEGNLVLSISRLGCPQRCLALPVTSRHQIHPDDSAIAHSDTKQTHQRRRLQQQRQQQKGSMVHPY